MRWFIILLLQASTTWAQTARVTRVDPVESCSFEGNRLEIARSAASLVVRLENPPRSKVVLAIDGQAGFYRELVWDPTVADGLQHDLLLPAGEYHLLAFADDDRLQTAQTLMVTSYRFTSVSTRKDALSGDARVEMPSLIRTLVVAPGKTGFVDYGTVEARGTFTSSTSNPRLWLTCDDGRMDLSVLQLNTKELQQGAVARGFLDQAAPKVVTDSFALLAEIAVERAKSGAMELVRERFVDPICRELNLERLRLGTSEEPAFPRTCTLLRNLQFEDLLAAGRDLMDAARDDVRMTLLPRLISKLQLPPVAREVAQLALRLGNEMLEGGGSESAALDLVIAQMDRILGIGAASSFDALKDRFVAGALTEVACATDDKPCNAKRSLRRKALISAALQRFLPTDPGELLSEHVATDAQRAFAVSLQLDKVKACTRAKDTASVYIAADKTECVEGLATHWAELDDWKKLLSLVVEGNDGLVALVDSVRSSISVDSYEAWLETNLTALFAEFPVVTTSRALQDACAVRVAIGIVKWCSGRDRCTTSDIAVAMANPENLFQPPKVTTIPPIDNLCWDRREDERLAHLPYAITTGDRVEISPRLRIPAVRGPLVELAARALAFLTPAPKGEERERVLAVLRWMFDVAKVVEQKQGDDAWIGKLQEVVELFAKRDYVRAISQTVSMSLEARGCVTESCVPDQVKTALKLLGAVGSYLRVYDETRDKDAAEARAARKKAIENLIDVSTDRRERAGDVIFSFGIPVGVTGSLRWTPETQVSTANSDFKALYGRDRALSWRLPLALAVQRMTRRTGFSWHAAVTFADLGNFVRGDANGADDAIAWKDFVQFGGQLGLTYGNRRHTVVLAADVTWSPGLYERDIAVTRLDGRMETLHRSGALMMGVTLAYYVPIFDLN